MCRRDADVEAKCHLTPNVASELYILILPDSNYSNARTWGTWQAATGRKYAMARGVNRLKADIELSHL